MLAFVAAGTVGGAGSAVLSQRSSPFLPIVLLAVLIAVGLALANPLATLHLALALVPLELLAVKAGKAFAVTPTEALIALSGIGWLWRCAARGRLPFVRSSLTMPLGVLVGSILPGLAVAPDPFKVMKAFVMWSCFYLAFNMVVGESNQRTVRSLLLALTLAGGTVGLIAIVTTAGKEQVIVGFADIVDTRATGTFTQPNTLGTFLALTIPFAVMFSFSGLALTRTISLGALVAMIGGLSLSLSRGGLLGAAAGLAVMLRWAPFRRVTALLMVLLAVLAIGGANVVASLPEVSNVVKRLQSIDAGTSGGVNPRVTIYKTTPSMISDRPVFGVGANNFVDVAPDYGLYDPFSNLPIVHAHNVPLTIAAELGLVGLGALACFVVALVKMLGRATRSRTGSRGLAIALAAAFAGFSITSSFDYILSNNVIAAIIFILSACAAVLGSHSKPQDVRVAAPSNLPLQSVS